MAYIAVDKKGTKVKIFVISQQNIRFGYSLEAPPRVSTTVALVERGYPHIIFLISARKHMLWVLIRTHRRGASNEYPQHIFSCRNEKNVCTLF